MKGEFLYVKEYVRCLKRLNNAKPFHEILIEFCAKLTVRILKIVYLLKEPKN